MKSAKDTLEFLPRQPKGSCHHQPKRRIYSIAFNSGPLQNSPCNVGGKNKVKKKRKREARGVIKHDNQKEKHVKLYLFFIHKDAYKLPYFTSPS